MDPVVDLDIAQSEIQEPGLKPQVHKKCFWYDRGCHRGDLEFSIERGLLQLNLYKIISPINEQTLIIGDDTT